MTEREQEINPNNYPNITKIIKSRLEGKDFDDWCRRMEELIANQDILGDILAAELKETFTSLILLILSEDQEKVLPQNQPSQSDTDLQQRTNKENRARNFSLLPETQRRAYQRTAQARNKARKTAKDGRAKTMNRFRKY